MLSGLCFFFGFLIGKPTDVHKNNSGSWVIGDSSRTGSDGFRLQKPRSSGESYGGYCSWVTGIDRN